MKRVVACLMGVGLCVSAHAQWGKFWRAGKSVLKPAELTVRVQARTLRMAPLPAAKIRSLVAAGETTPRLVFSVLSAPEAPAFVHNEFLTLSLHPKTRLLPEQSSEALRLLRQNLQAHTEMLDNLPELSASGLDPNGKPARLALEALSDAYGIGWFGTMDDWDSLINLYQRFAGSGLEPVAFTAAARGLTALKAFQNLEKLLAIAPRTQAYESFVQFLKDRRYPVYIPQRTDKILQSNADAFQEPMEKISKPGLDLFDFSIQASSQYQATADRLRLQRSEAKDSPSAGAPAAEASASVGLQTPSLQNAALVLEEPSLELSSPELPLPSAPTFEETLRPNPITKRFPSGLQDEEQVIKDWLEYYNNGYFRPRDQIEAIRGMSAAKANNVMEYFYYMSLEEAERVILDPIRQTGRLPDFMYDDKLIPGTKRLPAGYYKNKFNENIRRFVELAEEDGSFFLHNVELKELADALEDYTFEQGFSYANNTEMAAGLRRNWRALVDEIQRPGFRADRTLINELWRRPVAFAGGKTVSLAEYFTQTRRSAFFENGSTPEFFLNSPKWVALENERRNLAAAEYISRFAAPRRSWWDKVQDFFILGKRNNYLSLDQFGSVMVTEWRKSFGLAGGGQSSELAEGVSEPSSLTVKINNFDKVGGVCQMSFSDGGYAGPVRPGYDGTSTVNRFEPVNFENVPVVAFDYETMAPRVLTLASVPYVKDLKKPDLDQLRAGTMVGDGLDPTRDLLSVQRADAALRFIPHLKATIYPRARLAGRENLPPFLDGGGLGAYLALFTPDFFPLKKINRWRWVNGKLRLVPEYFVRKEVPALAGSIHRDHITFTEQVESRAVDAPQSSAPESK